ncbi:MAG: CvpA family protein [Desulfuromonadales bacterium]|nr:MAG: CvpA family protein [Desulfuromonadales bacterium]
MSLLDIVVWAVLLAFAVKGFMKGLVREVCSLLGLVVGGWAAFTYYQAAGAVLGLLIHLPPRVASTLAFLCILLAFGLLFFFLGHFVTVVLKVALLGGVNRVGGVGFGLLQGALFICLVLYVASIPPVPEKMRIRVAASATARAFSDCGREIVTGWRAKSADKRSAAGKRAKDVDDSRR